MHKEILTQKQIELLPLKKNFSNEFGLVSDTAIALYLGHRRSIDFDLFSQKEFSNQDIATEIKKYFKIDQIIYDEKNQYSLSVQGVIFTFLLYPYPVVLSNSFEDIIKMPDILSLAAMKAFALGRRAKWKDYVDMFFLAKMFCGIKRICLKAREIFGNEFNEKLFRSQLAYFDDINYSEEVIFLPGFEVSKTEIKNELVKFSLE